CKECFDRAHIAKNLKKNIAKLAKGNGDRAVRNFANAVVRARQKWLDAGSDRDAWLWAETFIEYFCHLPFHLQGNHDFCSEQCLGSDKYVMPQDDPDGEMLLNTPSEGVDFFEEATG
ncbi:unnamed protein product, partial [Ectocarpus fasciculatus]